MTLKFSSIDLLGFLQSNSTASIVAALSISVVVSSAVAHGRRKQGVPSSTRRMAPWYFPGPLDVIPVMWYGKGLPYYIRKRRKITGSSIFTLDFLELIPKVRRGPYVIITNPDDILKINSQQRKLGMVVAVPETVTMIHGKGNLQSLAGAKHAFHRKIFSSLLSPQALEGFCPHIIEAFERMWDQLSATAGTPIVCRDVIQRTQFFLMAKILYGIDGSTPESPERDLAEHLQQNFRLEDEALFALPSSKQFQKGYKAAQENKTILWDRFLAVLETERKSPSGTATETTHGNSFQAIARSLVESGQADVPETLTEVKDNLLLLLEASHGTTMNMTTSLMYLLNHSDNHLSLAKLREEAVGSTEKNDYYVTLAHIRHEMPFADACINETMRLVPIIGTVALHMPEGNSVTLPSTGETLEGPIHLNLASSHWYKDEDLFPLPEQFLPERWMENCTSPSLKVSVEAKKTFVPFGGGAKICLGQSLARIVLKANLHCFARRQIKVTFDETKVKLVHGIFPEVAVKDGLPCTILATS